MYKIELKINVPLLLAVATLSLFERSFVDAQELGIASLQFDSMRGMSVRSTNQANHTYQIEYKESLTEATWQLMPGTAELIAPVDSTTLVFAGIDTGSRIRIFRIVDLVARADMQVFAEPENDLRTTAVHDIHGEIVRVNRVSNALVWEENGESYFPGQFFVNNQYWLGNTQFFQVRFGTENGIRRAYFTETATGTICDLRLSSSANLQIFPTSIRVPNP